MRVCVCDPPSLTGRRCRPPVQVNPTQTVGGGLLTETGQLINHPASVLKWRGCDWGGEGSCERGLMNTGRIDPPPTMVSSILPANCWSQHFVDLYR